MINIFQGKNKYFSLIYFDLSRWLEELILRRGCLDNMKYTSYKDHLSLFWINLIVFFFKFILDVMILKRNKFLSQWRKFEFKWSYIFKDMDFWIFWIFLDFFRIYFDFNPFKKWQKGGIFSARTTGQRGAAWDPRGCEMTPKATWQCHADPREHLHGVDVARTRGKATRAHADARVTPRGTRSDWIGRWWAHGLVGLGNSIGAVTQRHYFSPPFIRIFSADFFRVGLCSREIVNPRWRGTARRVRWDRLD